MYCRKLAHIFQKILQKKLSKKGIKEQKVELYYIKNYSELQKDKPEIIKWRKIIKEKLNIFQKC